MTTTSVLPDVGIELREGYAEIGDTTLHYVEAGDGPLIVLLHGFPEFWFGWRLQIAPLVGGWLPGRRARHAWLQPVLEAGGFQGIRRRPARRRHSRSDRRTRCGVRIVGRSRLGRKHRLDRRDESPRGGGPTRHPQRSASASAFRGTAPSEPGCEVVVLLLLRGPRTARGRGAPQRLALFPALPQEADPPYTPEEIDRYVEAWSQPGAASGMINYYRASVRQSAEGSRCEAATDFGADTCDLGRG